MAKEDSRLIGMLSWAMASLKCLAQRDTAVDGVSSGEVIVEGRRLWRGGSSWRIKWKTQHYGGGGKLGKS